MGSEYRPTAGEVMRESLKLAGECAAAVGRPLGTALRIGAEMLGGLAYFMVLGPNIAPTAIRQIFIDRKLGSWDFEEEVARDGVFFAGLSGAITQGAIHKELYDSGYHTWAVPVATTVMSLGYELFVRPARERIKARRLEQTAQQ